jgi:hypothetical protein
MNGQEMSDLRAQVHYLWKVCEQAETALMMSADLLEHPEKITQAQQVFVSVTSKRIEDLLADAEKTPSIEYWKKEFQFLDLLLCTVRYECETFPDRVPEGIRTLYQEYKQALDK